jgi:AcrR family transcriptional regulator
MTDTADLAPGAASTRRRRLTREQRAEQLLAVAEGVFVERGLDGASIDAIAAAAGVTRPVVYEHFSSKEEMFLLLMRRARQELNETLAAAVVDIDDHRQRLRTGIDAVFRFIEADRRRWALLFDRLASSGDVAAEQAELRTETVAGIAVLLQAAAPRADALTIAISANALSGAAEQVERWWRAHPDTSRERIVEDLVQFAWQGLEALTSASDS